jgi:flagellar hook-length control protein FliK
MSTPAINPANLLQVNAPAPAKPDLGANANGPSFNQMLSREMNNDQAATPAQNASAAASKDAPKSVQQDGGSKDDSARSDSTASAQDNTTTDAGKKAEDDGKVAAAKDAKKGDDKDKADPSDPTDQAGIAAFVAALTSAKAAPAADKIDTAAATPAAVKVDGKADIKARNERIDIAGKIANADGTAADGKQEAVGKQADFVSALDKAKADAGGSGAKDASATARGIDLSAVAQAVKTPDAAALGAMPQSFAAAMAAAVQPNGDAQQNASSNALLPTVGAAGWDDALGQKVVWMAKGMEQTATLTLNPPELGPMQVTVNVSNNQATANFFAHQPEVRHALEASMPRLRDMLNEAGIQLGQSSVSAGMPNQNGFDEARQGGSSSGRAARSDTVDAAAHVSHVATPRSGSGNGMVDTFA